MKNDFPRGTLSTVNGTLPRRGTPIGNHYLRSSTEIKDFPTFFSRTNGNAIFFRINSEVKFR